MLKRKTYTCAMGEVQFMNGQGKCMCVGHMYEDFVRPLLPSVIMSHFIDTHIV